MSRSKHDNEQVLFHDNSSKIEMLRMSSTSIEMEDVEETFKREDEDHPKSQGVLKIHTMKKPRDNLSFSISNILQTSNGKSHNNKSFSVASKYLEQRTGPCSDQDSDANEDESGENIDDRGHSDGTAHELEDSSDYKDIEHDTQKRELTSTPPVTASSYAALFTASNKEQIESARNIIRVPAHRPQLPSLSLGTNPLSNIASSSSGINTSNSIDITALSHSLLPTSVASSQMGNLPTEFLPWTPFRPFSAALPGYLPIQAGFLGPKFGGTFRLETIIYV